MKKVLFSLALASLVSVLCHQVNTVQEINKNLQEKVDKLQTEDIIITSMFKPNLTDTVRYDLKDVTVTSYNNLTSQTDNTPNITATNRPVREGIVAVSPDLLKKGIVHYGDLLYISCFDKWYVVEDTMNPRFEKRIDVFLFDKQESLKINKKCNVKVVHFLK